MEIELKNNKAFTLLELVVVIAIIGILVLLAMPKFLGHTKNAKLAQIVNDIKVNEDYTEKKRIEDFEFTKDWSSISEDALKQYNQDEKLYNKEGLLQKNYTFDASYQKIPNDEKNSRLDGDFLVNKEGDTLYYDKNHSHDEETAELCTFDGEERRIAVSSSFSAYLTTSGEVYMWETTPGTGESEYKPELIEGFENIKSMKTHPPKIALQFLRSVFLFE